MRKIYLTLLLSLAVTWGFSQITLLDSDMGSIGDVHYMGTDTNVVGISIGTAGTNQTWDLSQVVTSTIDTIEFLDPVSTPAGANFPTATLCVFENSTETYNYLRVTTSVLDVVGVAADPFGLGTPTPVNLNPTRKILTFPMNYGDSFLDTSLVDLTIPFTQFPGFDSARYKSMVNTEIQADGWGDLVLSSGTFQTLRVKEISRSIDSVWGYSGFLGWILFDNSDVTDSSFTWWDKVRGFALASATVDSSLQEVTYVDPSPISGLNELELMEEAIAFPVPSTGWVHFRFPGVIEGELYVYDSQGRVVATRDLKGSDLQIDLGDQSPGVYFYRILDENSGKLAKGKLILE